MATLNNIQVGQRIGDQTAENFQLSQGLATSTAAAATINLPRGQITTEAVSTAAAAVYTFTLTNSLIVPTSQLFVSVGNGTNTTGVPNVATVTTGAGTATIAIQNIAAAAALNGTLKINFFVMG